MDDFLTQLNKIKTGISTVCGSCDLAIISKRDKLFNDKLEVRLSISEKILANDMLYFNSVMIISIKLHELIQAWLHLGSDDERLKKKAITARRVLKPYIKWLTNEYHKLGSARNFSAHLMDGSKEEYELTGYPETYSDFILIFSVLYDFEKHLSSFFADEITEARTMHQMKIHPEERSYDDISNILSEIQMKITKNIGSLDPEQKTLLNL